MKATTLQLEHTETLLDVVFGVVIAVALTDLPRLVEAATVAPSLTSAVDVLLLAASLLFATFYWLEARHFIAEQHHFNVAVGFAKDEDDSGVPVNLAGVLIGTLLMMTVASGVLTFARSATYRQFIWANVLFWLADFGGSVFFRINYRRFGAQIERARSEFPAEHAWYWGHMRSLFFVVYGGLNALIFFALYVLDRLLPMPGQRLAAACAVLAVTIFRHLVWRSRIYSWSRSRQLRRAA